MISYRIYDAAGETDANYPYPTTEPRLVSISPTAIVLRSRVLDGPFAGEPEIIRMVGSFNPATVNGTVDAWQASIAGALHYELGFEAPIRLRTLLLNFDDLAADGVRATGNRFSNYLEGDRGADLLVGNGGNDTLSGRFGNDTLRGGFGRDTLLGGAGRDLLEGGDGADLLDGGKGNDTMSGGDGDDVYVVDWFDDQDIVIEHAGGGYDIVQLSGFNYQMPDHVEELRIVDGLTGQGGAAGNGLDNVMRQGSTGGPLFGGRGDDRVLGAGNVDSLYGGAGDDIVRGRGGEDLVDGGNGRDRLWGDAGNDDLDGGPGRDRIYGGGGDDRFWGGAGGDWLSGGRGNDAFHYLFVSDSAPGAKSQDVITDFDAGHDIFDFWILYHPGDGMPDPEFSFIGVRGFSGSAGEVSFRNDVVRLDLDGDGKADMAIELRGGADLTADNFNVDL